MHSPLDVERLLALHDRYLERWHAIPPQAAALPHDETQGPWLQVLGNHGFNFQLWHEEDKARDPKAGDPEIAQVKRNIDRWNQARNDAVERIDEFLIEALRAGGVNATADAPLNSESAGSIADRLSILALRVYHMDEEARRADAEAAHRAKAADRLAILRVQRADLAQCLSIFMGELARGTKRLKVYRQMKMYNDPSMNPVLYRTARGGP